MPDGNTNPGSTAKIEIKPVETAEAKQPYTVEVDTQGIAEKRNEVMDTQRTERLALMKNILSIKKVSPPPFLKKPATASKEPIA